MKGALQIGPLVVPWLLALTAAAALAALLVAHVAVRRGPYAVVAGPAPGALQGALWQALLVGVVAARLGFAWEFRAPYLAAPLELLNLRDGGWTPWVGVAAAWLVVLRIGSRQPALKPPLRAGLAAGTLVWFAGTLALAVLQPTAGQRLPATALTTLSGAPVSLDSFRGRPVVVNLWATWCGPCVREMPVLAQAQRAHPGVHFVFVNQREPAPRVNAWLAAQGLPLGNVLLDPHGRTAAAFQQSALPTTLFFDAGGALAGMRIGELSSATLAQQLARAAPPP